MEAHLRASAAGNSPAACFLTTRHPTTHGKARPTSVRAMPHARPILPLLNLRTFPSGPLPVRSGSPEKGAAPPETLRSAPRT